MHLLVNYQQLLAAHKESAEAAVNLNTLNTSILANVKPADDVLKLTAPVLGYTQKQVMVAMGCLVEMLEDLTDVDACKRFFMTLYMQNCKLLATYVSAKTLDVPEYRVLLGNEEDEDANSKYRVTTDYMVWSYCYFGTIMRRFFYMDSLRPRLMATNNRFCRGGKWITSEPSRKDIRRCQRWVARLGALLNDESRQLCVVNAFNEGYSIPGDNEWVSLLFPATQGKLLTFTKTNVFVLG